MGTTTVKLADLGSYVTGLTEDRRKAMIKTVQNECATLGLALIQQTIDQTHPLPVDRSTYRRGWKCRKIEDGAALQNSEAHAATIERGRRPGQRQPPTDTMVGWVHRKGLAKKAGLRGKAARQAERGLAFVIARAIGQRGLKALWILKRAMEKFRPPLRQAIHLAASGGPG